MPEKKGEPIVRLPKLIVLVLVVSAISTAAFASAARLNLNSQAVQAGNVVLRGCQGDAALNIQYSTHYDNSISAFLVDGVSVGGLADGCVSPLPLCTHTIEAVLTFGPPAGGSQDLGTLCINANPVVYTLPAGSQPSAADLTDVHVLIK